ncbi:MAG: flavodoxin [Pseudomonadota bacterium]|jgi:flavodoxin II|nr:flavodoxin [Pseudomonadota bacterium]
MSTPIGLFYASTTGNTERVAEQIAAALPERIQLHDIALEGIGEMAHYQLLIMGISTWEFGQLQEDWEEQWPALQTLDFSGKKIALFGLGDQLGYGEWFLDAMGALHELLQAAGGELVLPWPIAGYRFEASKALTGDKRHFVGLALDEDSEHHLSEARINAWIPQLLRAFED